MAISLFGARSPTLRGSRQAAAIVARRLAPPRAFRKSVSAVPRRPSSRLLLSVDPLAGLSVHSGDALLTL